MVFQTINEFNDLKELNKQLGELKKIGICGIRLNFCKISYAELLDVFFRIKSLLEEYKDYYYAFDLPYPRNKTRIKYFRLKSDSVFKGKKYTIYHRNSIVDDSGEYIVLDCDYFEEIALGEKVYYGDGQGAFKLISNTSKRMEVVSTTDFKIYKNKAILCGFTMNEPICMKLIREICLLELQHEKILFLSLVKEKLEVERVKKFLNDSRDTLIMPKIESIFDYSQITTMLPFTDGFLMARGDYALLGNPQSMYEMQAFLSELSAVNNKRLFLATDVLGSLEYTDFPSRGDIIDLCVAKRMGFTDVVLRNGCKNRTLMVEYLTDFGLT